MEEIESIYKILAAILHLGEIRFDAGNEEDGCSIKNIDELETGTFEKLIIIFYIKIHHNFMCVYL